MSGLRVNRAVPLLLVLLLLTLQCSSAPAAVAAATDGAGAAISVSDRFDDHGNRLLQVTIGIENPTPESVPVIMSINYSLMGLADLGTMETSVPWLTATAEPGAQARFTGIAPPQSAGRASLNVSMVQSTEDPFVTVALTGLVPVRFDASAQLSCPPALTSLSRRGTFVQISHGDTSRMIVPAKWTTNADSTLVDLTVPHSELTRVPSDFSVMSCFYQIRHRSVPHPGIIILLMSSAGLPIAVMLWHAKREERHRTGRPLG